MDIIAVTGQSDPTPNMQVVIDSAIQSLITRPETRILIGMDLGTDLMVADACVLYQIPFTACIAHPHFAAYSGIARTQPYWGPKVPPYLDAARFDALLEAASKVVYVTDSDRSWDPKYILTRNEYMAHWSEEVWAFSDGATFEQFEMGRPRGSANHMIRTSIDAGNDVSIFHSDGTVLTKEKV